MDTFLKNHPFAVEAFFESSIVLSFAFPKEKLQHLIPECLELDTYEDQFAFIAVAMVQTNALRPKGFPKFLGNDFFLLGYRVFVRYRNSKGKNLRGLYILMSETNKRAMEFFGNIFTHYNYETIDIDNSVNGKSIEIKSERSGLDIRVELSEGEEIALPQGSPFKDWKEARRFAGPLPFTFTYSKESGQVLIIEGVRENWKPAPVKVASYKIDFFKKMNLADAQLANAFIVKDIPYQWKKGMTEQWRN